MIYNFLYFPENNKNYDNKLNEQIIIKLLDHKELLDVALSMRYEMYVF